MSTKSQELKRLMQGNEFLVRMEEHILTVGGEFSRNVNSAFDAAGISPRLMVPELTSTFAGPQGSVLHIPVRVSERDGGRKSMFALGPGEELVAGIYVVEGTVFERRVRKSNGTDALHLGDAFTERISEMTGTDVQTHTYKVTAVGSKTGSIYLESTTARDDLDTGDLVNTGDGWCWFCNMDSQWWCGFPCFPGDFGDIFA